MTDELSIQQKRPSATPYVLGGGLLGAGAGFAATRLIDPVKNYVTETVSSPLTHEDIANGVKDSFESLSKEVEDKDYAEKLRSFKERLENAGSEWDAKKEEFIKNGQNQTSVVDTDEIKELNKQLEAAKTKLAGSEKALADAGTGTTVKVNQTKLQALDDVIKPLETDVKARKSVIELSDEIKKLEKEIATQKGQFRETIKLPEQAEIVAQELDGHKKTLEALKQKKNSVKTSNEYKALVAERKNYAKGSKEFQNITQQMEQMARQYDSSINSTEAKIRAIKYFKQDNKGIVNELDALIDTEARKMAVASKNKDVTATIRANSEMALEAKIKKIKGLTSKQRKDLLEQCKAQLNDRTNMLDRTLAQEHQLVDLTAKYGVYSENRKRLFENPRFRTDLAKQEEKLANLDQQKQIAEKRKAHVQKMWNERKAARELKNKKFVDLTVGDTEKIGFNYVSFKDTLGKEEKELLKAYHNETRKRASKVVKTTTNIEGLTATVNADKAKIAELTEQIAKKREGLPKQVAKSVDELTAEFIKNNGDRNSAIKKVGEDIAESLANDLPNITKKSKNVKGGKVAIISAGVALLGAFIGLALRPKSKEQV